MVQEHFNKNSNNLCTNYNTFIFLKHNIKFILRKLNINTDNLCLWSINEVVIYKHCIFYAIYLYSIVCSALMCTLMWICVMWIIDRLSLLVHWFYASCKYPIWQVSPLWAGHFMSDIKSCSEMSRMLITCFIDVWIIK